MTRTPSPANRSVESVGATASMTARTRLWTSPKLTPTLRTSRPNAPAPRIASARLATASNAFDGTQPVLRQSPPILPRSINTVGTPKAAAADNPPGPPPITQISGAIVSVMFLQPCPRTILTFLSGGARARSPVLYRHRQQGEQSQGEQSCDHSRTQHIHWIERHMTTGSLCGDAFIVRILLRHDHAVQPGPCHGVDDRSGNDTKRGGGDERSESNAGKGGHKIHQKKRERRNESQEKEITEGVVAKPFGKLIGPRTEPAQQGFADRRPRD